MIDQLFLILTLKMVQVVRLMRIKNQVLVEAVTRRMTILSQVRRQRVLQVKMMMMPKNKLTATPGFTSTKPFFNNGLIRRLNHCHCRKCCLWGL